MSTDRVTISIDDHGVADVALARPDKMNALDGAMFDALAAALAQLAAEPSLRAVVLHGAGRAFCAGLDMASFAAMGQEKGFDVAGDLVARTHGVANLFQHVAWGWRELPVPVVAALHGVAFGGGLQIALGADIRLVTADTKLCVMEVKWGLVPDMAGCVLMNQLAATDVVRVGLYRPHVQRQRRGCARLRHTRLRRPARRRAGARAPDRAVESRHRAREQAPAQPFPRRGHRGRASCRVGGAAAFDRQYEPDRSRACSDREAARTLRRSAAVALQRMAGRGWHIVR
jgi:hypothetical protein